MKGRTDPQSSHSSAPSWKRLRLETKVPSQPDAVGSRGGLPSLAPTGERPGGQGEWVDFAAEQLDLNVMAVTAPGGLQEAHLQMVMGPSSLASVAHSGTDVLVEHYAVCSSRAREEQGCFLSSLEAGGKGQDAVWTVPGI